MPLGMLRALLNTTVGRMSPARRFAVSWGAGANDFLPILFLLAATVLLMVGVMNLSFGRL